MNLQVYKLLNGKRKCGVCVYIYNGILVSHKKKERMPFAATWMDIEIIILSQRQIYDIAYILLCFAEHRDKGNSVD